MGPLYVILFDIILAVDAVIVANLVQNFDPIFMMLLTFAITTAFFIFSKANRLPALWSVAKRAWKDVLILNLFTALSWVGYFLSLKFIEPAIADVMTFAIGPILTAFFWRKLRPNEVIGRWEIISALGLVCAIIFLAYTSAAGLSGVGVIHSVGGITGIAFSILSGLGVTGCLVYSKKLSNAGVSASEMMAVRFWALLLCGLLFANYQPLNLNMLLIVIALAVIAKIVPLYILQVGIQKSPPMLVSLLLTLLPLMTYLAQNGDKRLLTSFYTLIGLGFYLLCSMIGIFASFKTSQAHGT